MIFDTNVLVYISKNILQVKNLISPGSQPKISVISYIEALGFPFSTPEDQLYMERICDSCDVIYLSDEIIRETIHVRKNNRVKLPDAIIYATALVLDEPFYTNNIADFKSLGSKVELINPFNL